MSAKGRCLVLSGESNVSVLNSYVSQFVNIRGLMRALCVWRSNNNFNRAVPKRRNSIWSILSLSTGEIKTHSSDLKPKAERTALSRQLLCLFTESRGYGGGRGSYLFTGEQVVI